MSATATRKSGGREAELADARQDHREAREAWKQLAEREARLRAGWTVDANGAERKIERDTEAVVARAQIEEERARIAHRIEAARTRLHGAKVEEANVILAELAERHGEATLVLDRRREALDEAWSTLVASAWRFAEARQDEQGVARRIVRTAKDGLRGDEERRELDQRAAHHLPTRLELDGVTEVVARPDRGLFGGEADPSNPETWRALGQIVVAGRRRGMGLIGRVLREHVTSALARLERDET